MDNPHNNSPPTSGIARAKEEMRQACLTITRTERAALRAALDVMPKQPPPSDMFVPPAAHQDLLNLAEYHAKQARMHLSSALAILECAQRRAEK